MTAIMLNTLVHASWKAMHVSPMRFSWYVGSYMHKKSHFHGLESLRVWDKIENSIQIVKEFRMLEK
jgi:hypothetical protein